MNGRLKTRNTKKKQPTVSKLDATVCLYTNRPLYYLCAPTKLMSLINAISLINSNTYTHALFIEGIRENQTHRNQGLSKIINKVLKIMTYIMMLSLTSVRVCDISLCLFISMLSCCFRHKLT